MPCSGRCLRRALACPSAYPSAFHGRDPVPGRLWFRPESRSARHRQQWPGDARPFCLLSQPEEIGNSRTFRTTFLSLRLPLRDRGFVHLFCSFHSHNRGMSHLHGGRELRISIQCTVLNPIRGNLAYKSDEYNKSKINCKSHICYANVGLKRCGVKEKRRKRRRLFGQNLDAGWTRTFDLDDEILQFLWAAMSRMCWATTPSNIMLICFLPLTVSPPFFWRFPLSVHYSGRERSIQLVHMTLEPFPLRLWLRDGFGQLPLQLQAMASGATSRGTATAKSALSASRASSDQRASRE